MIALHFENTDFLTYKDVTPAEIQIKHASKVINVIYWKRERFNRLYRNCKVN